MGADGTKVLKPIEQLDAKYFFNALINLNISSKNECPIIDELLQIAISVGCEIYYPFQGAQIGPFSVLSPKKETYL